MASPDAPGWVTATPVWDSPVIPETATAARAITPNIGSCDGQAGIATARLDTCEYSRRCRTPDNYSARILLPAPDGQGQISIGKVLLTFMDRGKSNDSISCEVRFVSMADFDTYIEVTFSIKTTRISSVCESAMMSFKFNVTNLNHESTVKFYDLSDPNSASRAFAQELFHLSPTERGLAENGSLQCISLPFNGKNIYAESMFSDVTYGSQQANVELIRSAFKSSTGFPVHLLVRCRNIDRRIDQINRELDEIRDLDPIKKFHPVRRPNTPVFIQMGSTLPVDQIPRVDFRQKLSFASRDEYVTIYGIALLCEFERVAKQVTEFTAQLRISNIHGAGNRAYQGFLDFGGVQARLAEDDTVFIQLDPNNLSEEAWRGTVTAPSLLASPSNTTILLYRPFDETTGEFIERPLDVHADINDRESPAEARAKVQNSSSIKVNVQLHVSDKVIQDQANALNVFQRVGTDMQYDLLRANDMTALPACDMFSPIPGTEDERCRIIDKFAPDSIFSPEQIEAKKMVRCARGNMAIVDGCCGTGKSDFLSKIIQPIAQTRRANGKCNQILIVACSNANVDDLTLNIDKVAKKLTPKGQTKHIVIRLHSTNSERDILMRDANAARSSGRKPLWLDEEYGTPMDSLNQLSAARHVLKNFKKATHRDNGISDLRVKLLEFSAGALMARVAGLLEEDGDCSDGRFGEFRQQYERYIQGDEFTDEEKDQFAVLILELHAYVLSIATFVVATPIQAGQKEVYSNFKPVLLVVDEAARLIEADLWILFAYYGECFMLMLGDPQQTQPILHSSKKENDFIDQLSFTPFERLKLAGASCIEFHTQHRFATSIRKLVSHVSYQNAMSDASGVNDTTDAAKARAMLARLFHEKATNKNTIQDSNVVLVKVTGSVTERLAQTTRVNELEVSVVLTVLEWLLTRGSIQPADIAVIVPYQGSLALIKRGIDFLDDKYPKLDLDKVLACTIDGSQGRQRSVVIFAFNVTSSPTFMEDGHRVTTGISRARHALILVGDAEKITSSLDRGIKLREVVEYMQNQSLTLHWPRNGIAAEHKIFLGIPRQCKHCGSKDHDSQKCPKRPNSGNCYNCGKIGHLKRNCPEPLRKNPCSRCGDPNHTVRSCAHPNP